MKLCLEHFGVEVMAKAIDDAIVAGSGLWKDDHGAADLVRVARGRDARRTSELVPYRQRLWYPETGFE